MDRQQIMKRFLIPRKPNYVAQGDEAVVFRAAFRARMPLILKGPTGCGKTRFVEAMAYEQGLPLVTVSCHEDLTAADLVGRFLFKQNETVWQDGPLTLAVRYGGICYLDEIVEARKDTTVIIHSLTDDRRMLYIDKTGEVIHAHESFMMLLSYNPGYQSIVKDLKQSTKQRFASMTFHHPSVDVEAAIICSESGIDETRGRLLAEMGVKIRQLKGFGLDEGVSSRLLVYVGRLIREGLSPVVATRHAISQTLSEDVEVLQSVQNLAQLYFGDLTEKAVQTSAQDEESTNAGARS